MENEPATDAALRGFGCDSKRDPWPLEEALASLQTGRISPKLFVPLVRCAFAIAALANLLEIAKSYYLNSPLASQTLPFDLFGICAALAALAISFHRDFAGFWKIVTLGLAVSLVASWTYNPGLRLNQSSLFMWIVVMLMATCMLVPWGVRWHAALTAVCLAAAAINTALVRPASANIGDLWLGLLVASIMGMVSNRLWARYGHAFARTHRRLQRSELRMRALLDASMDEVSVIRSSDRKYIYVNDEFLKRGYTREQVLGKSVRELSMWADERAKTEYAEKLRREGRVRNQEVSIRTADGKIVPHLLSSAIVDLGGERCVLSVARDITELKKIQNDLIAARKSSEQSEAKLRKMFDVCPDVICVISQTEGRIVEINDAVMQSGFSKEDAMRWRAGRGEFFANPAERDEFRRRLQTDKVVRNMEADMRTRGGGAVPCLLSAVAAPLGGEPCVIVFIREITELKRTERDLTEAREAALGASRAKSEFLSNMSHEIRTPLNAILGMADLLAETQMTIEQRKFVETMNSNGEALLDLIDGILDLAKIESGKLGLETTEFDLEELLDRVTDTLAVRAHEKGLELAARVMPGVLLQVVGDPLRLRQVLINLLGNAVKFTGEGQVLLTVANDSAPGYLRFDISDTGIGIPPAKCEAIFQSFTQADSSTTRRYGGSGLGLAIARRLVELMGGRIWVNSEVGRGSIFHFTAKVAAQVAADSRGSVADAIKIDGLRVLVADDNADTRLILSEMLKARGAQVGEAADGEQALAEIERASRAGAPYGIVLLDCNMPRMNGFEVDGQPGRRPSGTVIMMLTSDDLNQKIARLRELGVDSYLIKPVKRAELFKAIGVATGAIKLDRMPKSSARPDSAGAERSLRILLAEDSPHNRLLIEQYLKNLPYQLDMAENGLLALEKFTRGHYDLVLMDLRMPVMDGYAAVSKIRVWERRQDRVPTPIVALTASALEEDVRASLEAGCTAHLSKPVKKARLLASIRELTKADSSREDDRQGAASRLGEAADRAGESPATTMRALGARHRAD